jgi:glycosyltransferase involved in cell wall biosynthesis
MAAETLTGTTLVEWDRSSPGEVGLAQALDPTPAGIVAPFPESFFGRSANMFSASVIICSHNPRPDYLERTLAGLRAQDMPVNQWELLLVDNASSNSLTSYDLSWHPHGRHVFEPELGLASARQRGILESTSDILVFVDDDNVLESDFLSQALTIGNKWLRLGVWGGSMFAEFETKPLPSVMKHIGYLAVRTRTCPCCSTSLSCADAIPFGAGLCVRSSVAHAYIEQYQQSQIKLTDRQGAELASCGDVEISLVACKMGYEIGTFPELKLLHLIPSERVSEDYFVRLIGGNDYSIHMMNYKWHGTIPDSPLSLYNMAAFVKNAFLSGRTERRICLARTRARRAARRAIFEQPNG